MKTFELAILNAVSAGSQSEARIDMMLPFSPTNWNSFIIQLYVFSLSGPSVTNILMSVKIPD